MFRARIAMPFLAVLALAACDKDKDKSTATPIAQPTGVSTTTMAMMEAGSRERLAAPAPTKKEPIVTWKNIGLATPESVIHDDAADVYIASNINGKPADADGNGFISRLTPDGTVERLKWIEGGKNKVTLNAPKGLALMGDNLYVADLDTVRIFDRKTGAPNGEVKIPGAVFLNDLAVTSDGHVLVSDSGMKAGGKGFEPARTDAVYALDKSKKLLTIARSKDLAGPNGLLSSGDKVWVSSFSGNELYALDAKGAKVEVQKLPKGSLDGIVMMPGGDLLVASWEGNALYRGKPGGAFEPVIADAKSPADIGYDLKRTRVLVPLFESDEIRAYELR